MVGRTRPLALFRMLHKHSVVVFDIAVVHKVSAIANELLLSIFSFFVSF